MPNHKIVTLVFLALIVSLMTSYATGQIVYGQPVSGNLSVVYSHWSLEQDSIKTDISQFAIPIYGLVPLQDNVEFRFFAANASNTVDWSGTEYKLSGMSDTRLQLNSSLAEDRILLSAGINLPTGKKKLSHADEQPVMAVLTQNYLNFPLRRLGEGLGVNLLAGAAMTSGETRLGGSIMYQINGSYEAYENDGDYKPGNVFSLSAGVDTRADKLALMADFSFTTYSADKREDLKEFKQSDQLGFHVGAVYGTAEHVLQGDIRYLARGRNERYRADETLDYRLKVYGDEFSFFGQYTYHPDPMWHVGPLVELRFISGNEFEDDNKLGSAKNIGFGAEFGRNLGEGFDFGIGFRYYTGNADDGNIDLTGYRFTVGLLAAF
jgi:hypothetical protein